MRASTSPAGEPRLTLRERLVDLFAGVPEDRKELRGILRAAAQRSLMTEQALNISLGALQLSEMRARDIMIPRSQLVCLAAGDPLDALLQVIIDSGHSRFPVIGDGLDDVKGILHAKDLLPLLHQACGKTGRRAAFNLKDCIRTHQVVPGSKPLDKLLGEFRDHRNHMAVVVDEYGHVRGAVTIEDVLEEIVGEIADEHDIDDDSLISRLDDGACNVKATTPVEDFNAYFGTRLKEDDFDTIGGIVLNAFGHMPERGEKVVIAGLRFEVLSAESRRLRLLCVSAPQPSASPPH